ncbi:DNA-binding response regulator [Cohnella sp. GCM10020058]|uniref:DNA-binding response regulator n=1 Tax=Cohnella sp. GCM10020058 TaxID=3317330 RepID=UPI0036389245
MDHFEKQYSSWLAEQAKKRSGEARRRLLEGHGESEKLFAKEIWWPLNKNFDFLHAEYEVSNYRDSSFYLDFAFVRPPYFIDWEIDDFAAHGKHVNRRTFEYERERQNQLLLDGWKVFRVPLDMIKERPRKCQQLVLQVMGKLYGDFGEEARSDLSLIKREIVRLAINYKRPFTPEDISTSLGISLQYARKMLHELVQEAWLAVASGSRRIRTYRLGDKAELWKSK